MPRLLIHLPLHQFKTFTPGSGGLYGRLWPILLDRGWQLEITPRLSVEHLDQADDADFHFVHQGLVRHPKALNTGLGYLAGSWYVDPIGILGQSSLQGASFDADAVPQAWAAGHLRRLRRRFVDSGRSKHEQTAPRQTFESKAINVFLQGPSIPSLRTAYMSEREMLEAVLGAANGALVRVKFHPRNDDPDLRALIANNRANWPNLEVVDAHVHDLLQAATVTCSLSSSVALEGMMLGVPAILCGQSDLHHCATTAKTPEDMRSALGQATAQSWPFAQFLYWLLRQQMYCLWHEDWVNRAIARLEEGGFSG